MLKKEETTVVKKMKEIVKTKNKENKLMSRGDGDPSTEIGCENEHAKKRKYAGKKTADNHKTKKKRKQPTKNVALFSATFQRNFAVGNSRQSGSQSVIES